MRGWCNKVRHAGGDARERYTPKNKDRNGRISEIVHRISTISDEAWLNRPIFLEHTKAKITEHGLIIHLTRYHNLGEYPQLPSCPSRFRSLASAADTICLYQPSTASHVHLSRLEDNLITRMVKVAINGFGRIGRCLFRFLWEMPDVGKSNLILSCAPLTLLRLLRAALRRPRHQKSRTQATQQCNPIVVIYHLISCGNARILPLRFNAGR